MQIITEHITLSTKGRRDVIDITPQLQEIIERRRLHEGLVTAFVVGSTAALTTIEYEPGLKKDLPEFLERILPYAADYAHHQTWHDDNGAGHLQAALIGPSLSIPVVEGKLVLGTWQQVVCVDCDTRPRERTIVVQIIGSG